MQTFTRRSVLGAVGAVGATVALPAAGLLSRREAPAIACATASPTVAPAYVFFDGMEAAFIEAACDRLIPADDGSPGALDVGAPRYLDRQLAGPWGSGRRTYREGPWQSATDPVLKQPPAAFFRAALAAIRRAPAGAGAGGGGGAPAVGFDRWMRSEQGIYLGRLAAGEVDLDGIDGASFFQLLLGMTVEAYFSLAAPGCVRDRIAWPMRGFPGACAVAYLAAR